MKRRKVAVLGATGSIGSSTISIIEQFPESFFLLGISGYSNIHQLAKIAEKLNPLIVVLADESQYEHFCQIAPRYQGEILFGEEGLCALASSSEADLIIAGIVGVAGLKPVEAALRRGKRVLLANKESLVCAGSALTSIARANGGVIIPIDSEHSAIFQLLEQKKSHEKFGVIEVADSKRDLLSITLTASGGPFWRDATLNLDDITPKEAIKHPRWSMGAKISIDSASLVNKALELIEAAWLFNLPEEKISIVIHPESIIHSLVSFVDGVQFAHLSVPDMKGAISFGMNYPDGRLKDVMKPLMLEEIASLTFSPLDNNRFPAPSLARRCLRSGGNSSAVFNLVNECAVSLFMREMIKFTDIVKLIEKALDIFSTSSSPTVAEIPELMNSIERWVADEVF